MWPQIASDDVGNDSGDSRTIDRLPTRGTRTNPISLPQPAIFKGKLQTENRGREREMRSVRDIEKGGRQQGESKPRKNQVFRPISRQLAEEQKWEEERHRAVKMEALNLWRVLDNPVYDSPIDPEAAFSVEAVRIAKRGRRCTMETHLLGSSETQRAIRNFERIAARHGNDQEQVQRLMEYPNALERYQRIVREVQAGANKKKKNQRRMITCCFWW